MAWSSPFAPSYLPLPTANASTLDALRKQRGIVPAQDDAPVKPPEQTSLLGRIGGFFTPDRLRAIGAGLHDLSQGSNTLPALLQQLDDQRAELAQRAWQMQLQDRQRMQWNQDDKSQEAARTWASSLPPGPQRDAAMVNPSAAYSAVAPTLFQPVDRPLTPEERQRYNVQDGSSAVMRGGKVEILQSPYHPPVAAMFGPQGRPPPGYRWSADGSALEPIPGGPAQQRLQTQGLKSVGSIIQRMSSSKIVRDNIARALQQTGGWTTGPAGAALRGVPGTPAHDLQQTLSTIRANIGFDALNEMRANSPTGGALGQVSERELSYLQSVMGSLEQSQTEAQFRSNLQRLQSAYDSSMQRLRAAYDQDVQRFGIEDVAPPPPATVERTYNPRTGRLE